MYGRKRENDAIRKMLGRPYRIEMMRVSQVNCGPTGLHANVAVESRSDIIVLNIWMLNILSGLGTFSQVPGDKSDQSSVYKRTVHSLLHVEDSSLRTDGRQQCENEANGRISGRLFRIETVLVF